MTISTVKKISLPVRGGGLNIITPKDRAQEYNRSKAIAAFLYDDGEPDAEGCQAKLADVIKKEKALTQKENINLIQESCNYSLRHTLDLAKKGASCWLNALPLNKYHFDLTKSEFRDGTALRYGWKALRTLDTMIYGLQNRAPSSAVTRRNL